jgi:hypothetical protein
MSASCAEVRFRRSPCHAGTAESVGCSPVCAGRLPVDAGVVRDEVDLKDEGPDY